MTNDHVLGFSFSIFFFLNLDLLNTRSNVMLKIHPNEYIYYVPYKSHSSLIIFGMSYVHEILKGDVLLFELYFLLLNLFIICVLLNHYLLIANQMLSYWHDVWFFNKLQIMSLIMQLYFHWHFFSYSYWLYQIPEHNRIFTIYF